MLLCSGRCSGLVLTTRDPPAGRLRAVEPGVGPVVSRQSYDSDVRHSHTQHRCPASCATGPERSPPFIYPPASVQGPWRVEGLRRIKIFSAKLFCMGDFKSRLTATKRTFRGARPTRDLPGPLPRQDPRAAAPAGIGYWASYWETLGYWAGYWATVECCVRRLAHGGGCAVERCASLGLLRGLLGDPLSPRCGGEACRLRDPRLLGRLLGDP